MSLVATLTVCLITRAAPSAVSGQGGPRGEGCDWSGARWGILLGLTSYITPLPRITSHITLSCHYPGHNTLMMQWPVVRPHHPPWSGAQHSHYQWPGLNIAKWPIFQCWVHCCDDVCWCLCIGQSRDHHSASRGHESCRRHNIDMSFPHHFLPPPMLLQDTLEQRWLPMIGLRIAPWLCCSILNELLLWTLTFGKGSICVF